MPFHPSLFLALDGTVPCFVTFSTARETFTFRSLGFAVCTLVRFVTFKLTATALTPEMKRFIQPSPPKATRHGRIDVCGKNLLALFDIA